MTPLYQTCSLPQCVGKTCFAGTDRSQQPSLSLEPKTPWLLQIAKFLGPILLSASVGCAKGPRWVDQRRLTSQASWYASRILCHQTGTCSPWSYCRKQFHRNHATVLLGGTHPVWSTYQHHLACHYRGRVHYIWISVLTPLGSPWSHQEVHLWKVDYLGLWHHQSAILLLA